MVGPCVVALRQLHLPPAVGSGLVDLRAQINIATPLSPVLYLRTWGAWNPPDMLTALPTKTSFAQKQCGPILLTALPLTLPDDVITTSPRYGTK